MNILNKKLINSLFLLAFFCMSLWHCPTTIAPTDQDPDMPDVPDVPDVPEPPDAPDLTVSLSKNKSAYLPTEAVTLMATVSNAGTTLSNATLFWYRSTDGSLDRENDTPLGSNIISNLAAGARVALTTSIAAANTASTNTYFAWADGGTNEVNPTNNSSATLVLAVPSGTYLPSLDFPNSSLVDATVRNPTDIWSDGTTMWVMDKANDVSKIYAYGLATRSRNSSEDFNTLVSAGNVFLTGIWADDTTMWVGDDLADRIYAYSLSTKARNTNKEFNTLNDAGNDRPSGIWSDGTTMWVGDDGDFKIYAYKMSDKTRDSAKDFDTLTNAGNTNAGGIWSDGTTMWVSDFHDDRLYAYKLSDKSRDSTKDFDTLTNAGNNHPTGIWSDGTIMWVMDVGDRKIFAYKK